MPFRVSVKVDDNDLIELSNGVNDIGRGWKNIISNKDNTRKQLQCVVDAQARTVQVTRLGMNPSTLNDKELPKNHVASIEHNDIIILVKDKTNPKYRMKFFIHDGPDRPDIPLVLTTPRPKGSQPFPTGSAPSTLKRKRRKNEDGDEDDGGDDDYGEEERNEGENEPRTDDEGDLDEDEEVADGGFPRKWKLTDFSDESEDVAPWYGDDDLSDGDDFVPNKNMQKRLAGDQSTRSMLPPTSSFISAAASTLPISKGGNIFSSSSPAKRSVPSSSSPVRIPQIDASSPPSGGSTPKAIKNAGLKPPKDPNADARFITSLGQLGPGDPDGGLQHYPPLPPLDLKMESRSDLMDLDEPALQPTEKKRGRPPKKNAEETVDSVPRWETEGRMGAIERWRREKEEKTVGRSKKKAAPESAGTDTDTKESVPPKPRGRKPKAAVKIEDGDEAKPANEKCATRTRNVTPYGIFAKTRRPVLKADNPDLTTSEITKLLKQEFQLLDEVTLADLNERAWKGRKKNSDSESSDSGQSEELSAKPSVPRKKTETAYVSDQSMDEGSSVKRKSTRIAASQEAASVRRNYRMSSEEADDQADHGNLALMDAMMEEDEDEVPLVKKRAEVRRISSEVEKFGESSRLKSSVDKTSTTPKARAEKSDATPKNCADRKVNTSSPFIALRFSSSIVEEDALPVVQEKNERAEEETAVKSSGNSSVSIPTSTAVTAADNSLDFLDDILWGDIKKGKGSDTAGSKVSSQNGTGTQNTRALATSKYGDGDAVGETATPVPQKAKKMKILENSDSDLSDYE
ncbi:hypothetical protein HDU97_002429 [Phlyctochytrium planicorne]|nr:hypothetical protein HDU97_002429 [Phlyctochytrium planicorne]